jgi:ribosome-associated translation inhibitor RaiA
LNIPAGHIDVTPALRNHVEEHFGKLNHLFDGDGASAHIIIEVEKNRNRSEIIRKLAQRSFDG